MPATMLEARQATGPSSSQHNLSPPYPPTTAGLGGIPTIDVDIPICAIFLVLFILGAISHMYILQTNKKRGHKFYLSGMIFGFCMSRIATMIMRMVWATRPRNVRVAIAAQIFVAAGIVLLFVLNVIFSQRIVRAAHPHAGWHPIFHWAFIILYVLIVATLIMLITSVIQSFYTLNANTKRIDRDILLYGQTFYAVVSFLPFILVLGGLVIPRKTRVEKFGHGRFRWKIAFLLSAAFLLCLGATYRAGTNYAGGERPINDPPAYFSKACFYIFNFTIEIIVIIFYVIVRVDKRFYVPDHSKKAGDYLQGPDFYTRRKMEKSGKLSPSMGDAIEPEEETFDDMNPEEVRIKDEEKGVMGAQQGDIQSQKSTEPLNTKSSSEPSGSLPPIPQVHLTPDRSTTAAPTTL